MNLNPVYKREVASASRVKRMFFTVLLFNTMITVVAMINMYLMVERVKITSEMQYGAFLEMYLIVATMEFVLLTLMVPALTAGSIAGERERQTLDLMLITKMKPVTIIIGKLTASFQMLFVLIISSFPILSLVFIYGGIHLRDLFILLALFYVVALLIGSFSIWLSVVVRKSSIATVGSYLMLLVLYGGTIGIATLAYYIQYNRYLDYALYSEFSIGNLVYLLLLNPGVTFYGLVNHQVGNQNSILKLCNNFGSYHSNVIIDNWIIISVVLQLFIAAIFLILASRALNPLRMKRGKRG